MSHQIKEMVESCTKCARNRQNPVEPLIPTKMPERAWQQVRIDLFEFKKSNYVLVVDYCSRFIEIGKLQDTTSKTVVTHLKSIFAHHRIPEQVWLDNGPQYTSAEFATFAAEWGFEHHTSSPRFPQNNGEAERAVQDSTWNPRSYVVNTPSGQVRRNQRNLVPTPRAEM